MDQNFKRGFIKTAELSTSEFLAPHMVAGDENNLVEAMGMLTDEEKSHLHTVNGIGLAGGLGASALAGAGAYGLSRFGVKPGIMGLLTGLAGAGIAAANYLQGRGKIDRGVVGKRYIVDQGDEGEDTDYYLTQAGLL